jgi:hypothetical protein
VRGALLRAPVDEQLQQGNRIEPAAQRKTKAQRLVGDGFFEKCIELLRHAQRELVAGALQLASE